MYAFDLGMKVSEFADRWGKREMRAVQATIHRDVLVHEIQHHIYYAAIAVHFAMWVATCRHASNIKKCVSKRMISRCVAAWGSWLRVQKFLLHQRQVMRRVTLKWQLKSIRTIHAGWIKYVASAASIKAIAVIVLRRSVKRTIGHFISSWMVHVSDQNGWPGQHTR